MVTVVREREKRKLSLALQGLNRGLPTNNKDASRANAGHSANTGMMIGRN